MAGALRELGVATGDRVVVQIDKSTDNVALYLACLRIGAVFLPLNTAYTSNEVGYFVDDASPTVVVARPGTLDDLGSADLARRIARKLEEDLQYPGQIEVTVIREFRAKDFAR